MSDYTELRDRVVSVIQGIPDIGIVHGRTRYAADWTKYLELFKTSIGGVNQIRGWTVSRDAVESSPARFQANEESWVFVIRGMIGLSDGLDTEGTLQELADLVRRALDTHTDLGVSNVVDYGVGPASMRVCEPRMFGSTLCNYCEITLPIDMQVGVTFVAN